MTLQTHSSHISMARESFANRRLLKRALSLQIVSSFFRIFRKKTPSINYMATTVNRLPIRLRGTTNFYDTLVPEAIPSLGPGKPVFNSTLVDTAANRSYLNQYEFDKIPNLVEMQLESYAWFLNVGLRELFDSFSPIEDFTGNMALEFLDYSLGETQVFARRVPRARLDLRDADEGQSARRQQRDRRTEGIRGLSGRDALQ